MIPWPTATSASTSLPENTSTTLPFLNTRSAGMSPRAMPNKQLLLSIIVLGSNGPEFAPGYTQAATRAEIIVYLGIPINFYGMVDTGLGAAARSARSTSILGCRMRVFLALVLMNQARISQGFFPLFHELLHLPGVCRIFPALPGWLP